MARYGEIWRDVARYREIWGDSKQITSRPCCEQVEAAALRAGIRVEIDQGGRSVSKQIKIANRDKVPACEIYIK